MNSIINIIYTPGTVAHLSTFVWSLLNSTSTRFRLVSNGCLFQEQQHLSQLSSQDDRLEFLPIPGKGCLPHGQALNYLQALTQDKHFCFLDSDIFAVSNFIEPIIPYLSNYAGIFSGMPLWVKKDEEVMPSGFKTITGMFNRTESGLTLGSTFFAVYDNEELTKVMHSTGIGFEEYSWSEIPESVQQQITKLGLTIDAFDTGKVLNLLLLKNQYKLINLELSSICHIGGSSFPALKNQNQNQLSLKKKLLDTLLPHYSKSIVSRLFKARSRSLYKKNNPLVNESELSFTIEQRLSRRNPTRRYFLTLIDALLQEISLPPLLITGDTETDHKTKQATKHLLKIFKENNHKIRGLISECYNTQ